MTPQRKRAVESDEGYNVLATRYKRERDEARERAIVAEGLLDELKDNLYLHDSVRERIRSFLSAEGE